MLLLALYPLESVEPPPMTEPMLAAAGQQFVACCPPSTSFGTRIIDINPMLLNLAQSVLPPPPPYTPTRHSHPTHNDLLRMHNTPMIVEPENEVDVVGEEEKDEPLAGENKCDEPLDLTVRRSPMCSPVPRASVITATGRSIVRSASSASTINDDVQEHFKRSLSGKWPRRGKTEDEKGRASPMRRHTSFNSHVSVPLLSRVKQHNCSDIEDHFRRALGSSFEQLMRKKEPEEPSVQSENLI